MARCDRGNSANNKSILTFYRLLLKRPFKAYTFTPPGLVNSTSMSDKQRLVLSIIDFLNQSIQDGTVKQDDQESLEVASKP